MLFYIIIAYNYCFHYNGSAGVSFLLSTVHCFGRFFGRSSGLLSFQTIGPSKYCAFGLLCVQTIEPSNYWVVGLSCLRTIGLSDFHVFGLLGFQTIGPTPGINISDENQCILFSFRFRKVRQSLYM